MKKILMSIMLCACFTVFAQERNLYQAETDHYTVFSEVSQEQASEMATRLEAYLELYNRYFHFDTENLPAKYKVRIFQNKSRYDEYLNRIISETREDFVYLHYSDLKKSELVGYHMDDSGEFYLSLNHQGFIQFIRSFIANPPLWLREGFAVFFEKSEYDEDYGKVIYKENLAWLPTLKDIIAGNSTEAPLSMEDLLSIDIEDAREKIEVFYPQAWGVISFLVYSENKDYNRLLWDAISALQDGVNRDANEANVEKASFQWVDDTILVADFMNYLDGKKTFRELVEDGVASYSRNSLKEAEQSFVKAQKLREDNFIPYYYLGLINYDMGNYSLAEYYYQTSLNLGAAEGLTYYALGVNAYADNRFDDAKNYLTKTIEADPASYSEKVNTLLARIEG
ncbi:MAG: tetratricopeptide repeat protein [Spirochaetia bacterium]